MYTLKFENEQGDLITLTGAEDRYQIIRIDGLNPPNALIHRSEVAGMDGTKYMSAKLEEREIVLTVRINGEVEKNRLNLYNYFKSKHYSKMYYSNGSRDVYIEGYVETIECDLFTMGEEMQISIICPNPYFLSASEIVTDISKVLGAFEFPFAFGSMGVDTSIAMIDRFPEREFKSIDVSDTITDEAIEFSRYLEDRIVNILNEGENETGLIIKVTAKGEVVNPTIYNVETREFFTLNVTMAEDEVLIINSNRGQKSVTLSDETTTTNVINKVARNSTWLTLSKGDNQFTYEADVGSADMQVLFTHRTRYQAV